MKIQDAKIGSKVVADDGYTKRVGKVYGKITNRWGTCLRIKFEDMTFDTCHSFTTVGIGWYYIGNAK